MTWQHIKVSDTIKTKSSLVTACSSHWYMQVICLSFLILMYDNYLIGPFNAGPNLTPALLRRVRSLVDRHFWPQLTPFKNVGY